MAESISRQLWEGVGQQRKIAPFGYYPLWSPDSSQILLQSRFESGSNRFYIAQLDGSPPRELEAEFLKRKKLAALSAAWHPDGKRITDLGRRFLS